MDLEAKGAKSLAFVATDDYNKFYSQCDRTMVGFVQTKGSTMTNHQVQCFYGIKESSDGKPKNAKKLAQTEVDDFELL